LTEEMDDGIRDLLVRGIAAVKAGDVAEARHYLEWVLDRASTQEQKIDAWWYLSEITNDAKQVRDYLENILAVDPMDGRARRKLAILDGKLKPDEVVDPDRLQPQTQGMATAEVNRFICPKCGGRMTYAPDGATLVCEYCAAQERISGDQTQHSAGQDFFVAMATQKGHLHPVDVLTFNCQGCGASFTLPQERMTFTCPFCGSAYVVKSGATRSLLEPDAVIPFGLDEEKAKQVLREWFQAHRAPEPLRVTQGVGMYLPVWSFSICGPVPWRGMQRQDQEWGRSGGLRFQEDKLVPCSGEDYILFDNLLVPATHNPPQRWGEMATTYQLGSLVPYASSYLANWVGVTYQVELGGASLEARQQAVSLAREQVMRGQEKQVIDLTINPANMMVESFKLLLLPVWLMRFSSAEKTFTILINGQTGTVRDERMENRGEALLKKILGTD
jgi:predicted RNA-binding Zn-ribbon protein involved in translation (DUF1610 family)